MVLSKCFFLIKAEVWSVLGGSVIFFIGVILYQVYLPILLTIPYLTIALKYSNIFILGNTQTHVLHNLFGSKGINLQNDDDPNRPG